MQVANYIPFRTFVVIYELLLCMCGVHEFGVKTILRLRTVLLLFLLGNMNDFEYVCVLLEININDRCILV